MKNGRTKIPIYFYQILYNSRARVSVKYFNKQQESTC